MSLRPSMGRFTLSMDRETWEKAGRALLDVGLSRSRFVELILRQVAEADTKTAGQMVDDINTGIFEGLRKKAKRGE